MNVKNCVMPFEYVGTKFIARPQRPFKPHGLAIWGAPRGAVLEQALIGTSMQLVCSYSDIPCRFFSYGDSYEQIAKLVNEGKEPPAWCAWDIVHVGMNVQLYIALDGTPLGPSDGLEVIMWGRSVMVSGPCLSDDEEETE